MGQSQITVAGISYPEPGKKQGKIQDTIGNTWNVWGDKLPNYRAGVTYDITYEANEFKGKTFNVIKTATPANPATQQAVASLGRPPTPQVQLQATAKDEMIFVCGVMNNSLSNANVNPFELTATELIAMVDKARQVWRNTLGKSQSSDDMNDSVPF